MAIQTGEVCEKAAAASLTEGCVDQPASGSRERTVISKESCLRILHKYRPSILRVC
jgi:hypothetical protein